ncbi:hypothetical protein ACQR3W_21620 [Rhodococcus ruber]|uniref:Uncharacterized protein n=1 Tax=Rhodococcus ruber TaxID=1830 RepID=A0A098BL33_9NOCA|nr:hypothetical protein [Rhodococcus ruber]MCZ4506350.1 hypothetical protein [Rhodococcus ruber]MCZ4533701.1 hypothetical protein [Rhodococcus ruber]OHD14968.1 MAG: hypothetical protein A2Y38_25475 [Spirochaetes bacterium GWB1_59_5]CDZ88945.1 hypothetical protein RHRU231_450112 [Rhodococcus ruber]
MTTLQALNPIDFGPARHGVHIFDHEDDWGWTAYGHHEPSRIVAAINALSRDNGVTEELHEAFDVADLVNGIQRRWANNIRTHDDYDGYVSWDWCDESDPGAEPITFVCP